MSPYDVTLGQWFDNIHPDNLRYCSDLDLFSTELYEFHFRCNILNFILKYFALASIIMLSNML